MTQTPIKVKCIFQGGGAKFATLLAAAEALDEMQNEKIIEIDEVAGASAGAIAAYCLSSSRSTSEFRPRLRDIGSKYIQHFRPRSSGWRMVLKALRGKPIYNESLVRSFIRELIGNDDNSDEYLSDLKIPINICSVNLRHADVVNYKSSGDSTRIEDALINSCAIPFFFRSFKDEHLILDGGICSNLPNSQIFNGEETSYLIAFSFEQNDKYEPQNLPEYCSSLISAAIDNSVRTAAQEISASGGYVCELSNDYKTFDFEEALNKGLSDSEFSETKAKIRSKLEDEAISYFSNLQTTNASEENEKDAEEFIKQVHSDLILEYPYQVQKSSMLAIPNYPASENSDEDIEKNILTKIVKVTPKKEHLKAVKIGITSDEKEALFRSLNWDILDKNKNSINGKLKIISENKIKSEKNHTDNFALIFLDERLPMDRCPVTIQYSCENHKLLDDLWEHNDWMRSTSGNAPSLPIGEMIVAIPDGVGEIFLSDLNENKGKVHRRPHDHETMGDRWHAGRVMTDDELKDYTDYIRLMRPRKLYGWRSEQVPRKKYFGVLIEAEKPPKREEG